LSTGTWPDSAVMAARSSSVSAFQRSCWVAASSLWTVLDRVENTSEDFELSLVRGVKIAAKASSVMALGKLEVTDIGRYREKKADAAISGTKVIRAEMITGKIITYLSLSHDAYSVHWVDFVRFHLDLP